MTTDTTISTSRARRPRWQWVLLGIAGLLVVLVLAGFFAVPPIARAQIEKLGSEQLARPVSVGRITFNPFTLKASIDDLLVKDKDGTQPLLAFKQLTLDGAWRSLIDLAPVLSSVRLVDPVVGLRRNEDGRYNIQDLIDKWSAKPPSNTPTPHFTVANIELDNGRIEFDDRPVKLQHRIEALQVKVPFVSSLPVNEKIFVEPKLDAVIDGSPFSASGKSLPFEDDKPSTLELDLGRLDLVPLLRYSPVPLPVTLASGRLELTAQIVFSQPPSAPPKVAITAQGKLAQVDLRETGGEPLLAFSSLTVEQATLAPIDQRYRVKRVTLDGAVATVHRRPGQTAFFQTLVMPATQQAAAPAASATVASPAAAASSAAPASPVAGKRPLSWQVEQILLNGARVDFLDAAFSPRPLKLDLAPLDAKIAGLSNDADATANWELSTRNSGKETLSGKGTVALTPLAASGDVTLDKVSLPAWWWVAAPHLALDASRGEAAASGQFNYVAEPGGGKVELSRLGLVVSDLALQQRWDKTMLATVPSFKVSETRVDLDRHQVEVGRVESTQGNLLVRRERDGRINFQRLTDPASIGATPETAAGPAPVRSSGKHPAVRRSTIRHPAAGKAGRPAASTHSRGPVVASASQPTGRRTATDEPSTPAPVAAATGADGGSSGAPWTVLLNAGLLDQYAIKFEDLGSGRAADGRIDKVRLALDGLNTAAGARRGKVDLSANFGRTGQLKVAGPLGLNPLGGELAVDARDIQLVPAQPYFTQFVNAVVSSGSVSVRGNASFDMPAAGPLKAGFKGGGAINGFAAVTKSESEDLLRWKALDIKAVDFTLEPMKVSVGEVALTDFYSRLILSSEGRLNVQDLLVKRAPAAGAPSAGAAPPAATPASQSAPPDVRIGRVSLVNGNIDFSDFFIKPNYSANLTGMTGSVVDLSPRDAGALQMSGKIDNQGGIEISGKINPLAKDVFLDIDAHARDIDLPRVSPYSVKYVGYGIEKGKLSANLKYKLVDRKLTAENNIVLDQLTFGDHVDSPTALKLPVQLAVSLLKDRNGVIDINMPITGSLDDPQFSIGGLVWKMIGNLIVKAVTAPFSLLAGLAGGGPEHAWLEFDAGSATLRPITVERLKGLSKSLADRPGLKMDMAGRADAATDRPGLKQLFLERQLKSLKLRDTVKGGESAGSIDEVTLTPAERDKYLLQAYKAASFERPRNALRLLADQTPAQMQAMLIDHVEVSDSDLADLANRRAQHAKDWLVDQGKIDGSRLFVVAPGSGAGEGPPARVDLILK